MHKTHYKLIVYLMIFLCLIVIPTSFAADADSYSVDDSIIYDASLNSADNEISLDSVDVGDEILDGSASNNDILSADYYFDSNASKDGNGTKGNPYKYLNGSRINNNSVIHLANGVYNVGLPQSVKNVKMIGQDASQTIIKNLMNREFDAYGTFTLINLTLDGAEIYNYGKINVSNVIFTNGNGQLGEIMMHMVDLFIPKEISIQFI